MTGGPERSVHLSIQKVSMSNSEQLLAVIYENADSIQVHRGENSGATMSGSYAVRDVVPIPLRDGVYSVTMQRDTNWNPQRLGVAVLCRDKNFIIRSAAAVPWPRSS
jgi:hypothetical protein